MGGKGKAAPAPDYTPIAASNEAAARIAAEVSRDQLAWAKETYATDKATADRVTTAFLATLDAEGEAAAADRERYQTVFQPLEDEMVAQSRENMKRYNTLIKPLEDVFIRDAAADRDRYRAQVVPLQDAAFREAATYDTPERRELEAGRAQADVAQQFNLARESAIADLASYGVDPSQARSGALDSGIRIAQAATAAGAANDARLRVENTGRALRDSAIQMGSGLVNAIPGAISLGQNYQAAQPAAVNVGRGYPGQIASGYSTAQGAGTGAVNAGLATTASGANTMGTGVQWAGVQNQALGNWGGNVTSMSNAATQANAQRSASRSSGLGAIAGGVLGLAGSALGGPIGGVIGKSLAGAFSGT